MLTPSGEEVLTLAEEMETRALSAERLLLGTDSRLSGRLTITTVDVLVSIISPVVGEFVGRYPDVDLSVHTDNRYADLSRREADVAIRLESEPPGYLVGRRVTRVDWAPYASPSLVERVGRDTPLSEWPWLVPYDRRGGTMIERWVASLTGQRKPVARVDSGQTVLELARAGHAAVVAPPLTAELAGLVRIGPPLPEMANSLWVLTHPDLRQTARVRAFMDLFAERADELLEHAVCT